MGQTEDSILHVCHTLQIRQLTELKQTKEWERYPNRFPRLYETLLPENLGKHCREWPAGKIESEIKLLTQENSKPQDPIVYIDGLVTKDKSWWGFIVEQGATTIHDDSAAYTVSISSLTMKVEAVTHASAGLPRRDSQTTHAIILTHSISLLQKVKSGMRSPDGMCRWSTSTFENSCWCSALDMQECREMTEQIDWRANQQSQVACFSEDLKC